MKPTTTNPEWLAAMLRIDQTDAWEARELIAKIPAALHSARLAALDLLNA